MAIQIYSFSALLDIDCDNIIANMTILKNTFPVTPTITAEPLYPYITFASLSVVPEDCVFNTNFQFSLVNDTGVVGAGYNKPSMIVPRVLTSGTDTIVDFTAYVVRPTATLEAYPFITYQPCYLNLKQYINA
jgi:hypothetical protein